MSKTGKTNYFGLVLSDKLFAVPASYAKKYEVQTVTVALTGSSNPAQTIYIDDVPISIPEQGATLIAAYNIAIAGYIETAFATNTKWTVVDNDNATVTFTRKDAYGTFDLISVLLSTGLTYDKITVARTTAGALTAAADLYNAMKTDSQTIVADSAGSYVNGNAYGFGLQKSAKLELKEVSGSEDNNGELQYEATVTANLVGLDDETNANVLRSAIAAVKGTRKYVYLIDTVNGLYIRCNLLSCNLPTNYEGNAKALTVLTAKETGAESDLVTTWTML